MLQKIASSNRDGAGIAWFGTNQCEYIKGIDSPENLNKILDTIKPPYAIHFRLASAGGKDLLLTHPFEISIMGIFMTGNVCC